MRAAKSGSKTSPQEIGQPLTDLAQQELDALRQTLDLRLTALETALETPGHGDSLERLVLDLARVATEEAAAASRQAALHAETQARRQIAARDQAETAARTAFDEERAGLEARIAAERQTAAGLQQALDEARKTIAAGDAATDAALHDLRDEMEKAIAQARRDQASAVDKERGERARLQEQFEAERKARAQIENTLDQERQARAADAAALAAAGQDLARLEAAVEAERSTGGQIGAALEAEREARVGDRAALAEERSAREQERATYETAATRLAESLAKLQQELDEARRELDARGTAADSARTDSQTLAARQAELVQALNDVEARAEAAERDRDAAARDRDSLSRERDSLARERDGLKADRDAAARDLERMSRDLDLARTGSTDASTESSERFLAVEAERTKLATALREAETELDHVLRERDVAVAKLDSASEAAEIAEKDAIARYQQLQASAEQRIRALELELLQKPSESTRDVELTASLTPDEDDVIAVVNVPADLPAESEARDDAPAPAAAPEYGAPRRASRLAFATNLEIQIDGSAAALIDLSITGAQVIADVALKPNRGVKIVLPGDKPLVCRGKVVWARLETHARGTLRYRAGVLFTEVKEAAIEAFMARYTDGT